MSGGVRGVLHDDNATRPSRLTALGGQACSPSRDRILSSRCRWGFLRPGAGVRGQGTMRTTLIITVLQKAALTFTAVGHLAFLWDSFCVAIGSAAKRNKGIIENEIKRETERDKKRDKEREKEWEIRRDLPQLGTSHSSEIVSVSSYSLQW